MLNALLAAITVLYPFAVYFLLDLVEPRAIAFVLFCVLCARFVLLSGPARSAGIGARLAAAALVAFGIAATFANSREALLYYPVLVNAVLLVVFADSLLRPPSAIERLARIREPDLPLEAIRYTRQVTLVWCCFFLANGAIAAWTATYASIETWSLYNGLISYLLIGALFLGEMIVRRRVRRS